jgi:hypothetical protein
MPLTISGDTPNFSAATITTGTITTATIPTATVTTLNTPTGVLATQNGMTGIAKAWAQFTGSATAVTNGSFNISSITTTATGYYTIAFTTAMANANYSAIMSCGTVISGANSSQAIFTNNSAASVAPLTTGFTVTTGTAGWGAYANVNWVCIAVFST